MSKTIVYSVLNASKYRHSYQSIFKNKLCRPNNMNMAIITEI